MRVTCTNCGGAHTPWDCKRPAKKSSGGSSEAEHRPSKSSVVGSIPTRRSNIPVQDAKALRADAVANAELEPAQEAQILRPGPNTAGSSNGRTAPFDGVNTGSSPVPASIQKRPRGRPKSITDMAAYKAAKQREYRAKWKGRE